MGASTKTVPESLRASLPSRFLIVIGRQYGSGGRRIGRYIADALGIPYYDKTLLREAAQRLGFEERVFRDVDEKRPSFLRSLLQLNYGSQTSDYSGSGLGDEGIYELQSRVIKQLCEEGPCVIVGRTADYVMRDFPSMVSLFLHAPDECRAAAIVARGDAADIEEALDKAKKEDRKRESYYNYFTNRRWGHAANYHLCVDSSRCTPAGVLAMVIDMLNNGRHTEQKREE